MTSLGRLAHLRSIYEEAGLQDETAMVRDMAEILFHLHNSMALGQTTVETVIRGENPYWSPVPGEVRSDVTRVLEEWIHDVSRRVRRPKNLPAGEILDRHILVHFRLKRPDVIPTPSHVIDMMVNAVKPRRRDRVAVPRCGPGSLVVRARGSADLLGFEDAPDLARIAEINMRLNEVHAQIMSMRDLARCPADIVLAEALAAKGGSLNDGTLIEEALSLLRPGGRAAVLVQPGFLGMSGTDKRDSSLLRYLLHSGLALVASLPVHSFQPHASPAPTLVVIHKEQRERTWFLRLTHDGYPAGRDRDLTEPPRGKNDLTLVPALIAADRRVRPLAVERGGGVLHVRGAVLRRFMSAGGAVLETQPGFRIDMIEPVRLDRRTGFRALVVDPDEQPAEWVGMLSDGTLEARATRDDLFPGAVERGRRTVNHSRGERLLIDRPGQVRGTAVAFSELTESFASDLRPERYLRVTGQTGTAESPLQMLQAIWRRHKEVEGRLERLLRLLETPLDTLSGQATPAVSVPLFTRLSPEQETLWQLVAAQRDATGAPAHFEASEVARIADMEAGTASAALELFCRLGLIRAVTVDGIPCYRLLTANDIAPTGPPRTGGRP